MSFPRYPKYKPSGVEWLGEVPEHWETRPLKALATMNDDVLPETTEPNYEMNYVDIGSVSLEYGIEKTENFAFASAPSRARRRVMDGDVLVSTVRTYLRAICPIERPANNLIVSTGFAVIRPNREFHPSFARYALQSAGFIDEVISRSTGVSYPAINPSELAIIHLPSLPLSGQSAIAAFLDRETGKIDVLVEEQRRLIELLKEKRQAVISHAVTKGLNPSAPMKPSGIDWLGDVPEHWQVKRLKHIKALTPNAFVDGPFGSNLKSEHFIQDGEVYVIESNFATQGILDQASLKSISSEHFDTIRRSEVQAGDIVIAKIGAQFGKASILPEIDKLAVVSGNSLKLTVNPERCSTEWGWLQLTNLKANGEIDLLVNGSAQPALSLGAMNQLACLLPPIDEQHQIVAFVKHETEKIDRLIGDASHAIDLLQERRTALISAAVTGKIDVRKANHA